MHFKTVSLQEVTGTCENDNVGTVPVTEIQSEEKSFLEEIKTIKIYIQTITGNQSVLCENQNTIIAQLSELSINLEEFIKQSLST